jgi:riboflavin synthase
VNLERALRLGDRLEGHLVLGHVDGVGRVVRDRDEGGSVRRTIAVPRELAGLLAEKGSVAVDGISLTIAEARASEIAVALIPQTWQTTTMALKRPGDPVNLECDVLARYVRRLLADGGEGFSAIARRGGALGSWFDEREGTAS